MWKDFQAEFQEKLDSLGGDMFHDEEFPPNEESLIAPANQDNNSGFTEGVEWHRTTDMEQF